MNKKTPMKKFVIREVETVKTTAAFYDCKICLPFCEILGDALKAG
ncbi:hypothetical protein [Corallococcus aberystwythensis]|nr:hypothetical protein [Corallococcus aberystwythensis]